MSITVLFVFFLWIQLEHDFCFDDVEEHTTSRNIALRYHSSLHDGVCEKQSK